MIPMTDDQMAARRALVDSYRETYGAGPVHFRDGDILVEANSLDAVPDLSKLVHPDAVAAELNLAAERAAQARHQIEHDALERAGELEVIAERKRQEWAAEYEAAQTQAAERRAKKVSKLAEALGIDEDLLEGL
jgi:hypothetical protein